MKRSTSSLLAALFAISMTSVLPALADDAAADAPRGSGLTLESGDQPEAAAEAEADGAEAQAVAPVDPFAPLPPKFIQGFISNEFTTHYFKRGFIQEDKGIIAQPMFNLTVIPWGQPKGWLNAVAINLGTRESIHSEKTGAEPGNDFEQWYEADAWAGLTLIGLDCRLKFDAMWVYITTPSDAFPSFQELDLQLTFLDDGLLPNGITLHPYVLFVQELDGSAFMGDEGNYIELGLEPFIPLCRNEVVPVAVSFPMRVGLGLHDYYDFIDLPFDIGQVEEETLGFGMIGATLHFPIKALPQEAGRLVFNIGVDVIFLGDNMELLNSGQDHEIIGRMGLVWSF